MDTNGYWLHSNTFICKWNPRMEYADLKTAFQCVVDALKVADQSVTVIFDLSETKHIDICAPMNAINSGFLYQRNLKEILIVKADQYTHMLANMVSKATRKQMLFFKEMDAALAHLEQTI